MTPIPIERFLVPGEPPALAPGFNRSRQELRRGVPFQWSLDGDLSLVLVVPTGFAALWRDADPAAVVSSSGDELEPHVAPRGVDPLERPAMRLVLRRTRAGTLATIPLASGLVRLTPDGDGAASVVELLLTGWLIHAGCVRGPGDFGSFIEVAWRRADQAVNAFSPAPIHPAVAARNQVAIVARVSTGGGPSTGGGASTGGSAGSRVVVTREDDNNRNLEFRDERSGRVMTRADFVAAIRGGHYPDYVVRVSHGVETPMARPNRATTDNLG